MVEWWDYVFVRGRNEKAKDVIRMLLLRKAQNTATRTNLTNCGGEADGAARTESRSGPARWSDLKHRTAAVLFPLPWAVDNDGSRGSADSMTLTSRTAA